MRTMSLENLSRVSLICVIFFQTLNSDAAYFGANGIRPVPHAGVDSVLAGAVAIAVLNTGYTLSKKTNTLNLDVGVLNQFCKDEMFFNEPSVPFSCTGFLIAPDLLVTAGHCVYAVNTPNQELKNESGLACEAFDWLFGYQQNKDGSVSLDQVSSDELYHCKQIIFANQKETSPYPDYALIRLDRPVKGRVPLTLALDNPKVGSSVKMMGHPFGTPTKISDQAQILRNSPSASSIVTNLDAFVGFSGSPVFNSENKVIGILVGGTPSANTYEESQNKCERLNHCDDKGQNCVLPDQDMSFFPAFQQIGSDVQRIDPIRSLLQSLQN